MLVRVKEDYDGAEPSPNSVAAMNLLRLWQMTDRKDWRDKANATFRRRRAADSGRREVPQLAVALEFQPVQAEADHHRRRTGRADTHAMLDSSTIGSCRTRSCCSPTAAAGQAQLAQWLPVMGDITSQERKSDRIHL